MIEGNDAVSRHPSPRADAAAPAPGGTRRPAERSRPAASAATTDPAPSPLVRLRGLRVFRGPETDPFVLDVAELDIARGRFTSILGGSGIGKTTLLNVLGLLRGPRDDPDFRIECHELAFHLPASGPGRSESTEIVYRDLRDPRSPGQMPFERRERLRRERIGLCLQGGELLASLSLADNCAVPAELCSLDDPRGRSTRVLAALGLIESSMGDLSMHLPGSLSGGQKQRGVLARALVHDPDLVILDEPTASLDRGTAREAIEILRDRARVHGRTVVMVTHDHRLAEEFSDTVVEMDLTGRRRSGVARVRAGAAAGADSDGATSATSPSPIPDPKTDPGRLDDRLARPPRRATLPYSLRLGVLDAIGPLATVLGSPFRRGDPRGGRAVGQRARIRWSFPLQLVKNALIVVAVGLLVLLMRGMQSGLVHKLRKSLLESPTARVVTIASRVRGAPLTEAALERLRRTRPEIDLIVPAVLQPVVTLHKADESEAGRITLAASVPEDPALRLLDPTWDFAGLTPQAVVIESALARREGKSVGDSLTLWLAREKGARGESDEWLEASLQIARILEGPRTDVVHVHVDFARDVWSFRAGRAVESRGWPSLLRDVEAGYEGFLAFCREEPGADVRRRLRMQGIEIDIVRAADREASLYGLLSPPGATEGCVVAYLRAESPNPENPRPFDASRVEALTPALATVQGVILPWNPPAAGTMVGVGASVLVGVSSDWLRWLEPRLVGRDPARGDRARLVPALTDADWRATPARAGAGTTSMTFRFEERGRTIDIPIDVVADRAGPPGTGVERTLFVPAAFLARMRQAVAGEAEIDIGRRKFLPLREVATFSSARIYAHTIDEVVPLHEGLSAAGYVIEQDEYDRVREIQGYAAALDSLARVVSILAALAALLTVGVVFHEVAESKRRMIGTLRTLGFPRSGVLTLLMIRAALVAVVAAALVTVVGIGAAAILNLGGGRICVLAPNDFLLVVAAIGIVCALGTLWPAYRVSRIDPVLALAQAEER